MFLLAIVDLNHSGRSASLFGTSRSLRRVGADVVVLINIESGAAQRLRRLAGYGQVETTKVDGADVAVFAREEVRKVTSKSGGFEITADGHQTILHVTSAPKSAAPDPPDDLYQLLLTFEGDDPFALVGVFPSDLNSSRSIDAVLAAGFIDTAAPTHARSNECDQAVLRRCAILLAGLRSYGEGVYEDNTAAPITWARVGS